MSIDTQDKRTASIGFGSAYRSGIRRPTATISAFLRGSCLGLYVPIADVVTASDSITLEFRSRIAANNPRHRTNISAFRSRTITMENGR